MEHKIIHEKNEQNVLTVGINHGFKPTRVFKNVLTWFKNWKWAFQRIKRGYADCDTWDMDTFLSDIISGLLEKMADINNGYPDKATDPENGFDSLEDWQNALRECAYKLYYSAPWHECEELKNPFEEENKKLYAKWTTKDLGNGCSELVTNYSNEDETLNKKYMDVEKEIRKKKEQYKNEALDFLKKYWYHLWW